MIRSTSKLQHGVIFLAALLVALAAAACTAQPGSGASAAPTEVWRFTIVPAATPDLGPPPSPEPVATVEELQVDLGPGFELAGRLSQGRWGLTATLLDGGEVVIVGGQQRISFRRTAPKEAEVLSRDGSEWVKTEPLDFERTFHTATLLDDGRLLVAGGSGRETVDDERPFWSRQDLATVEIYDHGSGQWSAASSMLIARQGARAALMGDGRVLVIGGASGFSVIEDAELYDSSSDRWVRAASMSVPRRFHTATMLTDGRVLVVGGEATETAYSSAEIYDPETNSWTATADMARPRSGHAALLLEDGRVMVVGGSDLGLSEGLGPETTAEVYDPEDGSWAVVATGLQPRRGHEMATISGGRVLVIGGEDLVGLPVTMIEIYDPASGQWAFAGSLPDGRSQLAVVEMPDGTVLIVGGGTAIGFGDFPDYALSLSVPEER